MKISARNPIKGTAVAVAMVVTLLASPALAQEPTGCDKFKWKLDRERALLTSADVIAVPNGIGLEGMPQKAIKLALAPFASAKLPVAPERAPKEASSFAGFVRIETRPKPGPYLVTLSAEAWVDVVQGKGLVKSVTSSGTRSCEGVRKSVRFDLSTEYFVVQVSGVAADTIRMTITPAND